MCSWSGPSASATRTAKGGLWRCLRGSELEADYLTLHFVHYPMDMYLMHIHRILVESEATPTKVDDGMGRAVAFLKLFLLMKRLRLNVCL